MKTATITFHAAHNYGSMLQAYALQQTLKKLGYQNDIINLRTLEQKIIYSNPASKRKRLFDKIKELIYKLKIKNFEVQSQIKYDKYEDFLKTFLYLTKEYNNLEDIENNLPKYDYYITGSDQCWNTKIKDFNWSYYLEFTKNVNKISYASSFGRNTDNLDNDKILKILPKFKKISVRDKESAKYIENLGGKIDSIVCDPVLLLDKEEWLSLLPNEKSIKSDYIFLYSPKPRKNLIKIAKHLSKLYKLPIVITNISGGKEFAKTLTSSKIIYKLDVGPLEFLDLVKNAKLVLSGSYHAILFSLIFKVPFFAKIDIKDNRMKYILEKYNFNNRIIDDINYKILSKSALNQNYNNIDKFLNDFKLSSIKFLKDSLS